jgi:hypothetical protein
MINFLSSLFLALLYILCFVAFMLLYRFDQTNTELSLVNSRQATKIMLLQIDLSREKQKYKGFKWSCAKEND